MGVPVSSIKGKQAVREHASRAIMIADHIRLILPAI